jgi:hypothetical protein
MTGMKLSDPDRFEGPVTRSFEEAKCLSDVAWTVLAGEEVIACLGLTAMWAGCAHVWGLFAEGAGKYPHILQVCKGLISVYMEKLSIRRLQATASMDWPEANRLLTHCGFEREATMKKYGPNGEDFGLFVRFAS